jgi:LPXTG-motif cell wall-anchored protein
VNHVSRRAYATFSAVAALTCFLLILLPARAIAQQDSAPGVSIQLDAKPKKAAVGDPIELTLDIATPPNYRAEILQPEMQGGDSAVLSFSPQPVATEPKGDRRHYRAKIVAAIYKIGSFDFPPVRIILEDGTGKKIQVASQSVTLEIQSIIGKDKDLKDLKKQAEIPEPTRWLLWLGIVLAAVLLALLAWLFLRRKKRGSQPSKAVPGRDPLDVAESDLKALLDRGLPVGGSEKKFYVLISDIVKRILEAGFGISTAEQTTSEIMDLLRKTPGMNSERSMLIESFLTACDFVKFAKYIPLKAEHEAAASDAFKILAAARSNKPSAVSPGSAGVPPAHGSE